MAFTTVPDQQYFDLLETCSHVSDDNLLQLRNLLENEQLISNITNPETGNTLLHEAIIQKKVVVVKAILSLSHVDEYLVQTKNYNGHTCLDVALSSDDSPEIVTLLKSTIAVERAKEFVFRLYEYYSKKYEKIRKRVDGDPVSNNVYSASGQMTNIVNVGSRAVGFAITGSIASSLTDLITLYSRRRRAKRIWRAHHQFNKLEKGSTIPKILAVLLIRDGFEIFACLEEHLLQFSYDDFLKWQDYQAGKLAKTCVRRMMDYIGNHSDESLAAKGHFSKSFVEGRLRWFQRLRPGKLAVVDEAGITLRNDNDSTNDNEVEWKHYKRSDVTREELFRKVFEFETHEKGYMEDFEETRVSTPHTFLLTNKIIEQAAYELLVKFKYEEEKKPAVQPIALTKFSALVRKMSEANSLPDVTLQSDSVSRDPVPNGRIVALGSDECHINQIVQDWKNSKMVGTLSTSWTQLAYKIDIPPQYVSKLRKKILSGRTDVFKVTTTILRFWTMMAGTDANVGALIDKLDSLRWTEFSRLVKNRYDVST